MYLIKVRFVIGKTVVPANFPCSTMVENGWFIGRHESVLYPGLAYFKSEEDAKKAYMILKESFV